MSSPFDARPSVRKRVQGRLPQNPEAAQEGKAVGSGHFPSWLHRRLPKGQALKKTGAIIEGRRLHTVCEEAKCPNLLECWSKGTATFLILGKACTRACGFCDIDHTKNPPQPDPLEPQHVGESAALLQLNHIVLTMVARDDLDDGGASHVADVITAIREHNPGKTIEALTSDFEGKYSSLKLVMEAKPDIFNHNIETVERLTPRVRHKATYRRTLEVLKHIKTNYSVTVKSGLMVGLGEEAIEVEETISDLKEVGVDIITIGQYLQPRHKKLLMKEFVTPTQFDAYADYGRAIGIPYMYCGPFIRSSYNAGAVLSYTKEAIRSI